MVLCVVGFAVEDARRGGEESAALVMKSARNKQQLRASCRGAVLRAPSTV